MRKLTIFILFAIFIAVSFSGYAQNENDLKPGEKPMATGILSEDVRLGMFDRIENTRDLPREQKALYFLFRIYSQLKLVGPKAATTTLPKFYEEYIIHLSDVMSSMLSWGDKEEETTNVSKIEPFFCTTSGDCEIGYVYKDNSTLKLKFRVELDANSVPVGIVNDQVIAE